MKLFITERAPGPRVAKNLVAIKQIDVEFVNIDMVNKENRSDAFLKINPAGQLPCLQLEDGRVISEVTAIAEYFEELNPDPVIVGRDAFERAETRMWMRRADIKVLSPMMVGFQHGKGAQFFEGRFPIHEDLSAPSLMMAEEGVAWFNEQLKHRQYLCGDRATYADIVFYVFVSFVGKLAHKFDPSAVAFHDYIKRMEDHAYTQVK